MECEACSTKCKDCYLSANDLSCLTCVDNSVKTKVATLDPETDPYIEGRCICNEGFVFGSTGI